MKREIVIALVLALFSIAGSAVLNEVSIRFPGYRDWIFFGDCSIWLISGIGIVWLLTAPREPQKVIAGLLMSAGVVLFVAGLVFWNTPWEDFGVPQQGATPAKLSQEKENIADSIEIMGFRNQAHGPNVLLSFMKFKNRASVTIYPELKTTEFIVNGVNLTPREHNPLPALRAGDESEVMFPAMPANILRLPPIPNDITISTELRYGTKAVVQLDT